jgi:hypothetical protein
MTFDRDPVRWTASPELAPEELRGPLTSAVGEGPSALQMKSLALKLAAISAGTAVAAGAATAKAAATTAGGASAKAAGVLTLGKALASLAIVGVVGTSAVLWQRSQPHEPARAPAATQHAPDLVPLEQPAPSHAQPAAPVVSVPAGEPVVEPLAPPAPQAAAESAEQAQLDAPAAHDGERQPARTRQPATRARDSVDKATRARVTTARSEAKHSADSDLVAKRADVPSEVELLRRARAALASRPRTAFALTEEHREHYPQGVFVQERDALAIEALLRAGDKDLARDLARRFIRAYPASPHAHRFRETMGL